MRPTTQPKGADEPQYKSRPLRDLNDEFEATTAPDDKMASKSRGEVRRVSHLKPITTAVPKPARPLNDGGWRASRR